MHKPDPWQVETSDGVQRPTSVQMTTHLPSDASQDDKAALMQNANDIVNANANGLHRFVNNARQQQSLSGRNQSQAQFQADQMKARWLFNNGLEKLMMDVYPTREGGSKSNTSEKNLDGYIVWIHGQPGFPDTGPDGLIDCGPFMLVMNGYVIEPTIQPRNYFGNTNAMYYALLFGKTALLSNSYVGDFEQRNPLLKLDLKKPNRLVPNVSGVVEAGVECDGTSQKRHAEMLGYWIFDWSNVLNPAKFISVITLDTNSQPIRPGLGYQWNQVSTQYQQGWAFGLSGTTAALGDPTFAKGIYFPDIDAKGDKSPLLASGKNTIGTLPSAGSPKFGTFVPTVDVFVAEFYDRGKYSTLVQSWTIPAQANRSIAATNKPVLFAKLDYQNGYSTGNGSNVQISLDPQDTKDYPKATKTDANPAMFGPHDFFEVQASSNQGDGPGDALSDDQKNQLAQWRQDNESRYAVWAKQLQDDSKVIYDQLTDPVFQNAVSEAHLIAAILRLYRGNIFQFTTGIYKYWSGDPIGYAINTYDPNYLAHPIYPSWATNGTVLPDNNYNIPIEGGYHEATGSPRVYYPNTIGGQQASVLIIPKFRDLTRPGNTVVEYARLVSNGINSFVDIAKNAYDSVDAGSYVIDIPGFHDEHSLFAIHTIDYSFYSSNTDDYWVLGPGQYSDQMPTLQAFMQTTMTKYDSLRTQLDALNQRKPPDPLPLPNIQGDISKFRHSPISGDWSFNQNP
jgi:hypothetical protein